jgi:hypothetical protein
MIFSKTPTPHKRVLHPLHESYIANNLPKIFIKEIATFTLSTNFIAINLPLIFIKHIATFNSSGRMFRQCL